MSISKAINNFTDKSPNASDTQEISVPKKAIEKNKNVSIIDPKIEEVIGATNHLLNLKN